MDDGVKVKAGQRLLQPYDRTDVGKIEMRNCWRDQVPRLARRVARTSCRFLAAFAIASIGERKIEPRPCEFDRDGAVGGRDLGALIGAWGSQDPLFDLDRNGIVAGGDLAILLSNWSSR